MGIVVPQPGAATPAAQQAAGAGKGWTVHVIIYCDGEKIKKIKPDDELTEAEKVKYKKYLKKTYKGLIQYVTRQYTITGGTREYWMKIQHRVIERDDKKGEYGPLLTKLVTDPYFKQLYGFKPGYFDALYIIDFMETQEGNPEDPKKAKKKSGKKLTVDYRYCSNTLDLSQDTFKKAMVLKKLQAGRVLVQCHLGLLRGNPPETKQTAKQDN